MIVMLLRLPRLILRGKLDGFQIAGKLRSRLRFGLGDGDDMRGPGFTFAFLTLLGSLSAHACLWEYGTKIDGRAEPRSAMHPGHVFDYKAASKAAAAGMQTPSEPGADAPRARRCAADHPRLTAPERANTWLQTTPHPDYRTSAAS